MTDRELLDDVRRMRADGAPPKAIARALGVRPAVIAPLVRQLAAESPDGPAGLVLVLVARAPRHDRVSVCGYQGHGQARPAPSSVGRDVRS